MATEYNRSQKPSNSSGERSRRLTAEDWVAEATDVLAEENVRAVQISTLCKRLNTTKGSFYHHFKSRRDLLDAVIEKWRRDATLSLIERFNREQTEPIDALAELLALAEKPGRPKAVSLFMNLREWARRDERAREALIEIDRIRLKFFEQLFQEMGYDSDEATIRGYIAYVMELGHSIFRPTLSDQVPTEEFVDAALSMLLHEGAQFETRSKARKAIEQNLSPVSAK